MLSRLIPLKILNRLSSEQFFFIHRTFINMCAYFTILHMFLCQLYKLDNVK